MAAYTTAMLVSSIERKSFAPNNQSTFDTGDMLEIATEEMQEEIIPNITGIREEYFVFNKDITIVPNTAAYDMPARAFGMIARDVQLLKSDNSVSNIIRVEPESVTTLSPGSSIGFYLRGNQIILDPPPSTAMGTLRVPFFLSPGQLIETTDAGVVSAIDTVLFKVTVTTIPSTWVTSNSFDFIKQDGAHEYISIDNTSSDITSNVLTFTSLPSTLRVGDYVALAGESPLVQLPPNYRSVLAQRVAATILSNMNQPGADKAEKKAEKLLGIAQKAITPRVVGENRVIVNQNWW